MKILIIGAHPDDEILGVGGTLCKHIEENGDDVYVCIVTKAYGPDWDDPYINDKIIEQRKVDEFLKIKERYNLNLDTVKLNTIAHGELNKKISEIVEIVNPDIVYTHYYGDLNYDHELVFRASMVATRPPKEIKLICYETLSETEWNNKPFQPNCWINITNYIDKKIEAFTIYKSEVKVFPHPRSREGILALANKRGTEICVPYAESFMVIRSQWL